MPRDLADTPDRSPNGLTWQRNEPGSSFNGLGKRSRPEPRQLPSTENRRSSLTARRSSSGVSNVSRAAMRPLTSCARPGAGGRSGSSSPAGIHRTGIGWPSARSCAATMSRHESASGPPISIRRLSADGASRLRSRYASSDSAVRSRAAAVRGRRVSDRESQPGGSKAFRPITHSGFERLSSRAVRREILMVPKESSPSGTWDPSLRSG
jgi:hypothetical protein